MEVWKKLQNFGRFVFKDLEAVDTPDAGDRGLPLREPTPLQLIATPCRR